MGGGSMNAASLINFFINKKFLNIKKSEIKKISKLIGADVILGINPSNSILSSNGKVTKFKKRLQFYTLVVKPNFGCSTKKIFSEVRSYTKPQFNLPSSTMLKKDYLKNLNNDLEKIAFKKHPKLEKIKLFLETFTNVIFVRMSGSGSSIVAYFHTKKGSISGIKQFKRSFDDHWCITSKTI